MCSYIAAQLYVTCLPAIGSQTCVRRGYYRFPGTGSAAAVRYVVCVRARALPYIAVHVGEVKLFACELSISPILATTPWAALYPLCVWGTPVRPTMACQKNAKKTQKNKLFSPDGKSLARDRSPAAALLR